MTAHEAVHEATAGEYLLVALQWDQITSKPGQPTDFRRFRRGDVVELTAAEAQRLLKAGAVRHIVQPEVGPDEIVVDPGDDGADDDQRGSTPDEGDGSQGGIPAGGVEGTAGDDNAPPASAAAQMTRPANVAPKPVWVDYAVANGIDRAAAEDMTKAEIDAEVTSRIGQA
ncbi:hypothetical protein [Rhodococcus sp. UNC363MFTsu5.1]|uniref:hypothetical protein n=1 Tax=Rhodococcus sp. UNC363MFTsu5.1 TaxID=1449069 RepID=UPI000481966D|nr:hypothetical protein [Rhodococcus sp. UNC363MFTsu5.1]